MEEEDADTVQEQEGKRRKSSGKGRGWNLRKSAKSATDDADLALKTAYYSAVSEKEVDDVQLTALLIEKKREYVFDLVKQIEKAISDETSFLTAQAK